MINIYKIQTEQSTSIISTEGCGSERLDQNTIIHPLDAHLFLYIGSDNSLRSFWNPTRAHIKFEISIVLGGCKNPCAFSVVIKNHDRIITAEDASGTAGTYCKKKKWNKRRGGRVLAKPPRYLWQLFARCEAASVQALFTIYLSRRRRLTLSRWRISLWYISV